VLHTKSTPVSPLRPKTIFTANKDSLDRVYKNSIIFIRSKNITISLKNNSMFADFT